MHSGYRSIHSACSAAAERFAATGIVDAQSCAEWLLCHLFSCTRTELLLRWNEPMPDTKTMEWTRFVERRLTGEPLQYITGEQSFYGLDFYVNPAVLIPRPETELLVEQILRRTEEWHGDVSVLDIGTGSGVIPVSLAVARPNWKLIAIDLSQDALSVAQTNAKRHNVEQQIEFVRGDGRYLAEIKEVNTRNIDILVSNPPYIPTGDLPGLQREVRIFEPRLALDGGEDGLSMYRDMIRGLSALSALPRLVAFETGLGQTLQVAKLLESCYVSEQIENVHDYAGIDRMVFAELSGWRSLG